MLLVSEIPYKYTTVHCSFHILGEPWKPGEPGEPGGVHPVNPPTTPNRPPPITITPNDIDWSI
jgi:hypothetical protein